MAPSGQTEGFGPISGLLGRIGLVFGIGGFEPPQPIFRPTASAPTWYVLEEILHPGTRRISHLKHLLSVGECAECMIGESVIAFDKILATRRLKSRRPEATYCKLTAARVRAPEDIEDPGSGPLFSGYRLGLHTRPRSCRFLGVPGQLEHRNAKRRQEGKRHHCS